MTENAGLNGNRVEESEANGRELAIREEQALAHPSQSGGGLLGRLGRVSSSALGSAQRLTQQFVNEAEHLVDVALTSEIAPREIVHGEVIEELDAPDDDPVATPDELRSAGDRLMARSAEPAGPDDGTHPAFEHILRQLAPDEVRILRLLFSDGAQPAIDVRTNRPFGVGSETVAAGLSMISEVAGSRHHDRIASYLGNLHRLGLIWFSKEQVAVQKYELLQVQPHVLEAISSGGRYAKTIRRRIEITPFGRDFYRASFTS